MACRDAEAGEWLVSAICMQCMKVSKPRGYSGVRGQGAIRKGTEADMHVLARILSSILLPGMRMQTCVLCRLCNGVRVSHARLVQSEHSEHMYIHPHMTGGRDRAVSNVHARCTAGYRPRGTGGEEVQPSTHQGSREGHGAEGAGLGTRLLGC